MGAGCDKRRASATPAPAETLEAVLHPAAAVASFKRLPGAHFRGSSTFRINKDALTTVTEIWLDERGNYRMVEENDQDGGREAVLFGRDLAVALRYGKLIRRPAQEPEPTRLLEEALGGPWAAWETIRRFAAVEKLSDGVYRIRKSATPQSPATSPTDTTPLRKWRDTVIVQSLEADARVDEKTGMLLAFSLKARFFGTRDQTPIEGEIAVNGTLDQIGSTAAVATPLAETLRPRQRTVLEERALLGDLGVAGSGKPAQTTLEAQ